MPIAISPEFLVNSTTSGNQSTPYVTLLSNGRLFATWESADGANSFDIRGRLFNADGSAFGNDFLVSSTVAGEQRYASAAALTNGRFFVTWQSPEGANGLDIRGRVFNADGTPAGNDFIVNTVRGGNQRDVATTALSDGRYVVTWSSGAATAEVKARVYNANGTAVGAEFTVNSTAARAQTTPQIDALSNGRFIVTWISNDSAATSEDVRGRIFESNGRAVGTDFKINTSGPFDDTEVAVTSLGGGRFAVVWKSNEGSVANTTDIRARFYDDNGKALSKDFIVNTTRVNAQELPSLTQLADGRVLMVWDGEETGGTGFDIRGRLFTREGVAIGSDFVINSSTAELQDFPSVTAMRDGRAMIVWRDADASPQDDIDGAIIDPRIFTGTAAGERWIGGGLSDTISGDGGNDFLSGLAGRDNISGGEGDDRITGGGGADTLAGDGGIDRFIYNNRFEGGDAITLFGGEDFLIFKGVAFGGLRAGALSASVFVSRASDTRALDKADRFIFRQSDDTLWYDANGSDPGGLTKIADFSNDFALRAADIFIV
jgi:Ca2+-binding RTX toxin-like protein